MRTISAELEALLRSRFQVAGDGYAGRLEVDYIIPGESVIGATTDLNLAYGTVTDTGTHTFNHPERANDGSSTSIAVRDAFASWGPVTVLSRLQTDLGTEYTIETVRVLNNSSSAGVVPSTLEYSTNGVDWTDAGAATAETHGYNWSPSASARYLRITATDSVPADAAGYLSAVVVSDWEVNGASVEVIADSYGTLHLTPKRINLNKNLRMGPDQAGIELDNEDLRLGFGPSSIFPTNSRCRIYQGFGDEETLTFTGVIDKVDDNRDPLTTALSCRSLAGPILVDPTFSTTGPQGADEEDTVRTEDNGVYLSVEVDYIATDRLTRAGWPTDLIDVAATSFVLDEFLVPDGANEWDTLTRLAAFVGFTLWDDEDGWIHFATLPSAAVDAALTADYEYEVGAA